ncbi:MAG: hypothetical protein ACOCRX_01805 [Candidatus Woesearchaeota archaeon]
MKIEEDYVKRILVQFIKDELKKGHSLEEIKGSLRDVGHTEEVINNAVNLVVGNYSKIDFNKEVSDLDKDLFFDSVDELANYVKDNMEHNVSISKIKSNLKEVGHDHDLVEDAINIVTERNIKSLYFKYLKYFIYIVPFIFYFFTDSNPLLIIFGFLPILFLPLLMESFNSILFPFILNLIHLLLMYVSFVFPHSLFHLFTINLILSYLIYIPYYNLNSESGKKKTKEKKGLKKIKNKKSINQDSQIEI